MLAAIALKTLCRFPLACAGALWHNGIMADTRTTRREITSMIRCAQAYGRMAETVGETWLRVLYGLIMDRPVATAGLPDDVRDYLYAVMDSAEYQQVKATVIQEQYEVRRDRAIARGVRAAQEAEAAQRWLRGRA